MPNAEQNTVQRRHEKTTNKQKRTTKDEKKQKTAKKTYTKIKTTIAFHLPYVVTNNIQKPGTLHEETASHTLITRLPFPAFPGFASGPCPGSGSGSASPPCLPRTYCSGKSRPFLLDPHFLQTSLLRSHRRTPRKPQTGPALGRTSLLAGRMGKTQHGRGGAWGGGRQEGEEDGRYEMFCRICLHTVEYKHSNPGKVP